MMHDLSSRPLACLFVCLFACLLLASPALAMQDDPGGFRGAKWGDAPNSIKGLSYMYKLGDDDMYIFVGGNMNIGGIRASSISYIFWQDKLITVFADFEDSQAKAIYKACLDRFGAPDEQTSIESWWHGKETTVHWVRGGLKTSLTLASYKLHSAQLDAHFAEARAKSDAKKGW